MFCTKCGAKVVDGSTFCVNCGNKIEQNDTYGETNIVSNINQSIENNYLNNRFTTSSVAKTNVAANNITQDNFGTINSNNNLQDKKDKSNNSTKMILAILGILIGCIGAVLFAKIMLSMSNTDDIFTINDPLNHTITIEKNDIYGRKVNLSYLYEEARALATKSAKISESEIDSLDATGTQKLALKKAVNYLEYGVGFSSDELISQLEYEKFEHEDAVYAVNNCKANFSEQAVIKAKEILFAGGYSQKNISDMLKSYKFSQEEVNYALSKINADYYEQAVWDACYYKYSIDVPYTQSEAETSLKNSGFSDDEIKFAIKVVYQKLR